MSNLNQQNLPSTNAPSTIDSTPRRSTQDTDSPPSSSHFMQLLLPVPPVRSSNSPIHPLTSSSTFDSAFERSTQDTDSTPSSTSSHFMQMLPVPPVGSSNSPTRPLTASSFDSALDRSTQDTNSTPSSHLIQLPPVPSVGSSNSPTRPLRRSSRRLTRLSPLAERPLNEQAVSSSTNIDTAAASTPTRLSPLAERPLNEQAVSSSTNIDTAAASTPWFNSYLSRFIDSFRNEGYDYCYAKRDEFPSVEVTKQIIEQSLTNLRLIVRDLDRTMNMDYFITSKVFSFHVWHMIHQDLLKIVDISIDAFRIPGNHDQPSSSSTSSSSQHRTFLLDQPSSSRPSVVLSPCPVCLTEPQNVASIPCGHVFCDDCIGQVTRCPLCRQWIVDRFKLFLDFQ